MALVSLWKERHESHTIFHEESLCDAQKFQKRARPYDLTRAITATKSRPRNLVRGIMTREKKWADHIIHCPCAKKNHTTRNHDLWSFYMYKIYFICIKYLWHGEMNPPCPTQNIGSHKRLVRIKSHHKESWLVMIFLSAKKKQGRTMWFVTNCHCANKISTHNLARGIMTRPKKKRRTISFPTNCNYTNRKTTYSLARGTMTWQKKKQGRTISFPTNCHCTTVWLASRPKVGKMQRKKKCLAQIRAMIRDCEWVSFFCYFFFFWLFLMCKKKKGNMCLKERKRQDLAQGSRVSFFLCGILHVQEEERENVHDEKR